MKRFRNIDEYFVKGEVEPSTASSTNAVATTRKTRKTTAESDTETANKPSSSSSAAGAPPQETYPEIKAEIIDFYLEGEYTIDEDREEETEEENVIEKDWPDVWTAKMVEEKLTVYPWLIAKDGRIGCRFCKEAPMRTMDKKTGTYPSKEWVNCRIGFNHADPRERKTKLTMLRNKVSQHLQSAAHESSTTVFQGKNAVCQTQDTLANQYAKYQSSTENIFRIAYGVAKMDWPYTDFPEHIDCHKANGVDVGLLLHTNKTCAAIINSIASDIRKALVKAVIDEQSKISIMVDESTTVANKIGLVIHIRACLAGIPTSFFLDVVHLPSTDALSIVNTLLAALMNHGLSDEFLNQNFICFVSNGASVMTGSKSGVATRLKDKFPQLVLWHCANHRLELAVHDSVAEVAGMNHFKIFIDSFYSLYSQSPELSQELQESVEEVSSELNKIGRVLDTQWSASSLRTVKAVWTSHHALTNHFSSKVIENPREKRFKGLLDTLTSQHFILNLAVMFDALEEIVHLYLSLQSRDVSMVVAHRLIDQSVKALESLATSPGKRQLEAQQAVKEGEFRGQPFSRKIIPVINARKFFRSLANSLKAKMLTVASCRGESGEQVEANANQYNTLLAEISILDPSTWPLDYDSIPRFGLDLVSSLCRRLRVLEITEVCADFKVFAAIGGRKLVGELVALQDAVHCMPVSTAECERAFSVMNTIITPKRNQLEIVDLSALMLISILGPPISGFKPRLYAKNWLEHGGADTISTKRKTEKNKSGPYSHLLKLF